MRYFYLIILLAAVILAMGMGMAADSIEELGGKPVTVLALDSRGGSTRLTFLGKDYEFHLSADSMTDWLPAINLSGHRLEESLQWIVSWCQDLAFAKTLDLPVFSWDTSHLFRPSFFQ